MLDTKRKFEGDAGTEHVAKRPKVVATQDKINDCLRVVKALMKHKYGWPFNKPVDPAALAIPDYFDVIKHPMDLGTIKGRLDENKYQTVEEFHSDVMLVWSNALTFNQAGSHICIMTEELKQLYIKKWDTLQKKWSKQAGGTGSTTRSGRTRAKTEYVIYKLLVFFLAHI
mmetsp:Transcript_3150/g.3499  ORF Transcript_3150/g.3499 Transcript_3150/m.3499 type:complete len:170 (+) Transcript_3150:20-529(+)